MKTILLALILFVSTQAHAQFDYSQTDFAYLFNNYRASQAEPLPWPGTFWPFDGRGGGSGINYSLKNSRSPAQKYDALFNTGGLAAKWEEENHTCTNVSKENKKDCEGWYGHCNGWTGAALFNAEPDFNSPVTLQSKTGESITFDFTDIKAYLSEMWLDASVSFDGTGTTVKPGKWIFDPNDPVSQQPAANNSDLTNYEAYWDVTPRGLFYALTNYVGVQKAGIAIDRFTGDEIWNQPLIAYRLLPITGPAQAPIERGGRQLYPLTVGIKIYWMNDDVDYNYKRGDSIGWNVMDPKFSTDTVPQGFTEIASQDHTQDGAVVSRYMSATFFFDAPVTMNPDGTKVLSAGRMIGDGVWTHADPEQRRIWYSRGYEATQVQPDFLWRPDALSREADYRNPYIDPAKVYKMIMKQPIPGSNSW